MELEGKRILFTGSDGFIGKSLVEELKRRGAKVLTLADRGGHRIDIRDWQKIREIRNLDMVYHLAAITFAPYSFENPRETYEINVIGTLNILELCRLCGANRIVFASSYVYGPPQYLPVDEKHPLNPTSPYARSKILGERLCQAYYEDYGLKCVILRPFNIYGEGQSNEFLIPSILMQLPKGKIELMDPEPRRDFLYIKDAIEAFVRVGEYAEPNFETFNIGFGTSYSVAEIAGMVVKISGHNVEVNYRHQRRKNEIMDIVADITRAREKLAWEPKIGLEEGLARLLSQVGV